MDRAVRAPGLVVREVAVSDAPAVVRLGRAVSRNVVANDASFRRLLQQRPAATTKRLVAELDGRLVAWAPSGRYGSGVGWFWTGVEKSERRKGIGGLLYGAIERRLREAGATRLDTTPEDDDGRSFLLRRGFEVANAVRMSELDPRTVEEAPGSPGIRVVSLAEAGDHKRSLFRLYGEGREDIPSRAQHTVWSYDEWRAETVDSPLIDRDASVVLLEGDEPVALAWLYSDREGHRAETLMAATRRDRRGRGLATLAKIESSRRAAALGITRIVTGNDLDNAAMLQINRRLGFTPSEVIESYVKNLGAPET
jgi:GNAT superfamily N-acetyltransferase